MPSTDVNNRSYLVTSSEIRSDDCELVKIKYYKMPMLTEDLQKGFSDLESFCVVSF